MSVQIKKYLSFFLLFLFLFPTIEKQLHALEHNADTHCTATDKHFHSLEHSCSICDYTVTNSNTTPETAFQFIISVQQLTFSPFIENVNSPNSFQHLPARAPPIA
jgi:hypothetical protein